MKTGKFFENDDKNRTQNNLPDEKMPVPKKAFSIMDIIAPLILVPLMIVLAIIFPFTWLAGGFSGTVSGVLVPFGVLIALVIVIFIYARWKKQAEENIDLEQKKKQKKLLTIIVSVIAFCAVGFLIYQSIKAEKLQKEYNETFYGKRGL